MERVMDRPAEQEACDVCGAPLSPGAAWCGLWLARTMGARDIFLEATNHPDRAAL